jgi:hypothetical protein
MADYDRRGSGGGSSYNPKKRRYRGEFAATIAAVIVTGLGLPCSLGSPWLQAASVSL